MRVFFSWFFFDLCISLWTAWRKAFQHFKYILNLFEKRENAATAALLKSIKSGKSKYRIDREKATRSDATGESLESIKHQNTSPVCSMYLSDFVRLYFLNMSHLAGSRFYLSFFLFHWTVWIIACGQCVETNKKSLLLHCDWFSASCTYREVFSRVWHFS